MWKSISVSGAPDNSSLSHFSAMTRPCWPARRAVRNQHRHAIEQAARRWRGGRHDDSARTRRKILISTQLVTASVHVPSMYFVAWSSVIGSSRLVRMRPTVVAAPAYRMASWPALCARLVASAAIDAVISTRIARSQTSRFSSGAPPAQACGHHLCGNQPVRQVHPTILH